MGWNNHQVVDSMYWRFNPNYIRPTFYIFSYSVREDGWFRNCLNTWSEMIQRTNKSHDFFLLRSAFRAYVYGYLVQVVLRWHERLGRGAQREDAGPSCLSLSNDLCIMKDGNNISHSLQGSTLWQDLHIHIFFPSPPLPFFHCKLFFLWAGHLPPWHRSGREEINKYM